MVDVNRYRILYTLKPRPMRHGTYNVHSAHATFKEAFEVGVNIPGIMLYDSQEDLFYAWGDGTWHKSRNPSLQQRFRGID